MLARPDRITPPSLLTLVLATATGALAMNIFLPSLPAIARHFDADYAVVQLTVSLYLGATAVLQLAIGPASDRFGRRPVMLACFLIFITGSVGAIYAPTIELLLAARVLQAFAAAGMVLSRAIVRDTVSAAESASKIGYITMGMSVVPMIGPFIGGLLDEAYGWQSTFLMTLGFGLLAIVMIYLDLGETNLQRSSSMRAQFGAYPELFRSRRFWGYTLTAAFTSGTFFAFLGGGPFVATEILGMSPSEYGLYFAFVSIGYMGGNFLSGRYSQTIGLNMMMLTGNVIAAVGVGGALLLVLFAGESAIALFAPVTFVGMGNGMTLPNANAGIVSVRPHLAGSASGLGGAMQVGGGAALSVVAGAVLSQQSGAAPLLWVMFVSSLLAVVATLYVMAVAHRAGGL